jgi:hypothetical protein
VIRPGQVPRSLVPECEKGGLVGEDVVAAEVGDGCRICACRDVNPNRVVVVLVLGLRNENGDDRQVLGEVVPDFDSVGQSAEYLGCVSIS